MAALRGTGLGAGFALGTAAVVREVNGIPFSPPIPVRLAEVSQFHRPSELPEVILIANSYAVAQAVVPTIAWAIVVGIAIQASISEEAPVSATPCVHGLSGLMESIEDDVLTLIDATRGVVILDPDPVYLAQYTAEHDKIAPKHRYSLDEADLPAQTLDGQTVRVYALPLAPNAILEALESGVDGYWVGEINDSEQEVQLGQLVSVGNSISGKSLLIHWDESLISTALVQAASQFDLTICANIHSDFHFDSESFGFERENLSEVKGQIEGAMIESFLNDKPCSVPSLAIFLYLEEYEATLLNEKELIATVERAALQGATRICVSTLDFISFSLEILETLVAVANSNLISTNLFIDKSFVTGQPDENGTVLKSFTFAQMIGAGVTELSCSHESAALVKKSIRELSYSECREKLLSV